MARTPKYRKHSTRNKGFVEYEKKRIYFPGDYNSAESLRAYASFIQDLADETDTENGHGDDSLCITRGNVIFVNYLTAKYLADAEARFVKNGRSTGTYEKHAHFVKPLLKLFGTLDVREFGPLKLKKVREEYVKSGLCRNEVNDRTDVLVRIFGWGVANELVPAEIADALKYVKSLRAGETKARETEPTKPVPTWLVVATIPFLPPTVDDMVRLQWVTGARPGEVRNLRWQEIDQSDPDVWIYTPWEHKTEHHKKQRLLAITKPGQEILEKYRHRPIDEFIFSPRETVRIISERKRAARKTKMTPSQQKRNEERANAPLARFNDQYTRSAYEHAIKRACRKAGVEEWFPNQIRHTFGTSAGEQLGIEAAQVMLGHSSLKTTEIYAEKTRKLLKEKAKMLDIKNVDAEEENETNSEKNST